MVSLAYTDRAAIQQVGKPSNSTSPPGSILSRGLRPSKRLLLPGRQGTRDPRSSSISANFRKLLYNVIPCYANVSFSSNSTRKLSRRQGRYLYPVNKRIPELGLTAVGSCSNASDTFSCLVDTDAAVLEAANLAICQSAFFGTFTFVPVVDGDFIVDRPTEIIRRGRLNGVSIRPERR